jgi:thymidylate synthase (methanogen type)
MENQIECKTTVECWKKALKLVIDKGSDFIDENERICREMLNVQITLSGSADDIEKPIGILNSFEEWKYPPLKEIKNVMLAVNPSPDYAYSYGPRIFNFQKRVNQVNNFIIPLLQAKPNTRKAVISLWDPVEDANIVDPDTPGLISLHFRIKHNRLNIVGVIRSNDMFFGWPANIYQIRIIQDYICKKIGCEAGSITTFSISSHLFMDQMEYIKKVTDEF